MSSARRLGAEAAATFVLVFLGTGACVVDALTRGALGVLGVGLVWGAAVFAAATAFGPASGAHMNPAVSFALWRTGRLGAAELPRYAAAQAAGALAASVCVALAFAGRGGALGATRPAFGAETAFVLETLMTFVLVLVVLRAPSAAGPSAAGAVVALEAVFGGPVSGASMNPVRSLAPALVAGRPAGLWIYLTAPMLGALAAAEADRVLGPAA